MRPPDRLETAPGLVESDWSAWVAGLPAMVERATAPALIYDGRNRLVRHDGPDGSDLVVKYFRLRRRQDRVIYRFRSGKAERSFRHARRLVELGIATPTPVLHASWQQHGAPYEAVYVCHWCDHVGTLHTLDRVDPERLPRLLADLGRAVAAMHGAGVQHRDLTPGNLLLVPDGDDWRFPVVDCNRMRFGAMSTAARVGNLVQLDLAGEALAKVVAAYAACRGDDADRLLRRCRARQRRYRMKWAIKNRTRPWRRKIGL